MISIRVCIEPPEYMIGLRGFEHYVSRTQPEGVPSGPGDLDLTIHGLRKVCRLALKGSPTVLLLFFIEGEHLLHNTVLALSCRRSRRHFCQWAICFRPPQVVACRGDGAPAGERRLPA